VTWSYSGNPANSDLDTVRFYVGDTNINRQLLQDEEVNFTISEYGNLRLAAAVCADAIAAKFSIESNQRVGDISKSLSDVAKAFRQLASDLRAQAGKRAAPSFPAASRDWKRDQRDDTDLVQPAFNVGQGDNPWAVQLNDQLDEACWDGW
jgi:hypothetical protein